MKFLLNLKRKLTNLKILMINFTLKYSENIMIFLDIIKFELQKKCFPLCTQFLWFFCFFPHDGKLATLQFTEWSIQLALKQMVQQKHWGSTNGSKILVIFNLWWLWFDQIFRVAVFLQIPLLASEHSFFIATPHSGQTPMFLTRIGFHQKTAETGTPMSTCHFRQVQGKDSPLSWQ